MRQALSFAHLLGHAGKNARADEPEDDQNDKPQGGRADDDNPDDDDAEPKGRKAKGGRADDDNPDDDDAEPKGRKAKGGRADDDNPDDDDDEPKGRRTAAEDDDEDEEERQAEEDDAEPKARAARKRERARCAAIFGSRHATGRVASAAHLAFNTKMTSAQAIGVLKTLPREQASAGNGLGARMDAYGSHRPSASSSPAPNSRQTASASWDRAFAKAGIQPKR
jgi:hypothetical protein